MPDRSEKPPVAPELFEVVEGYASAWSGLDEHDRGLRRNHPLVVFTESFLEQFSSSVLGRPIAGLSDASRQQLVKLRRSLEQRSEHAERQVLLFQLETICSFFPGAQYVGADDKEVDRFHRGLFPAFLTAIVDWCYAEEALVGAQLGEVAASARDVYTELVA